MPEASVVVELGTLTRVLAGNFVPIALCPLPQERCCSSEFSKAPSRALVQLAVEGHAVGEVAKATKIGQTSGWTKDKVTKIVRASVFVCACRKRDLWACRHCLSHYG